MDSYPTVFTYTVGVAVVRIAAMFAHNVLAMTSCPSMKTVATSIITFVIDITPVAFNPPPVTTAFIKDINDYVKQYFRNTSTYYAAMPLSVYTNNNNCAVQKEYI